MGSLDGAEVAELVGLYLLSQLSDLRLDIGLYCDDGLGVGTCHLDKQNLKRNNCVESLKKMALTSQLKPT